ncbi:MAG: glycoside hydrolase family 3 protein, partial [Clostridia bacterium]|nr:glycoside hydrolase family 3 protein [Clostridia bacterium]
MDFHKLPWDEADRILSVMTLEKKIGQMVIASIEVTRMDARTNTFLKEYAIGNVILFGKNCTGRSQIAALNREIQETVTEATGLQALISIDQEGGLVTRIREGATVFPGAMSVSATGDAGNAYKTGYIMGSELKALGIYHDLAPVMDCNFLEDPPVISSRSYASDPETTSAFAGAMARGLREAGILDCGKHFPGQGHTPGDMHFDFVV